MQCPPQDWTGLQFGESPEEQTLLVGRRNSWTLTIGRVNLEANSRNYHLDSYDTFRKTRIKRYQWILHGFDLVLEVRRTGHPLTYRTVQGSCQRAHSSLVLHGSFTQKIQIYIHASKFKCNHHQARGQEQQPSITRATSENSQVVY